MRNCSTVRLGDCSLAKNPLTGTDAQKLLHKSERRKFQDELRHSRTRQGRFDAAMLHLEQNVGCWKQNSKCNFAQCGGPTSDFREMKIPAFSQNLVMYIEGA